MNKLGKGSIFHMKKKKIILAMVIVLTGILIMPFHTYAVSKKQKALDAYANFLRKYESTFEVEENDWDKSNTENYKYSKYFAVCDIDANGVPELLTQHQNGFKMWDLYVYTYQNGKVKQISKQPIGISFNAMGGPLEMSVCKKNHLHVIHSTGYSKWDRAYKVNKKGTVKLYLECDKSWWNGEDQVMFDCKESNKKITSSRYKKIRKRCGSLKAVTWFENNRKGRTVLCR